MAKGLRVVYTMVVLLWSTLAYAQDASVLFVVDGSGSMAGRVKGQPKIGVAKAVMSDLLLKLDPAVRAGLLVYGHNRKDDCGDIEVMAPLGSERGAMVQALKGIQPKGKTPLTEAIRRAAAQFREYEGSASVVVVSDGKETCEGDPCAAASEASGAGVNLRIHVIGFDVTPEETEQLTCVADKGKGKYFAAADAGQLKVALEEVEKEVAAPPPPVAEGSEEPEIINIAGASNGGRIVKFTTQVDDGNWAAKNLIDGHAQNGWAGTSGVPQEVIIGFKGDQLAEITDIIINPLTTHPPDWWAKEVEFYGSTTLAWKGYSSIGRMTLKNEGTDQVLTLPEAVRAKYVKILFKSNQGGSAGSAYGAGAREVYSYGTGAGEIQIMGYLLSK